MGACTTEVHHDLLTTVFKYSMHVADAIVIESGNGLGTGNVIRALNLAKAVHTLPEYITMLNGTKWNGVPIVVLVDDLITARAINADPSVSFVTACSIERVPLEYYQYVDPWIEVYRTIDTVALRNGHERLEEMQSVGHRFTLREGRWLRAAPPNTRRRYGSTPELETRLYHGYRDQLIKPHWTLDEEWRGRDVALLDRGAVEHDLDEYEALVRRARAEAPMQRFYEQRPHMLGAGAFETCAHPVLAPLDAEHSSIPDLFQRSLNLGLPPKPARVIELKAPQTKIITKTGNDWHWSRSTTAGRRQARRYADLASDHRHKRQMEALFGEAPKQVEKLLIIGKASNYDREALDSVRKYEGDVTVRGFDEMLASASHRFSRK